MSDNLTLAEFDSEYRKEYAVVCGCDEAGRGPLAGDVFAAAVIFDEGTVIDEINDSKKLTEKKREKLFDVIIEKARAYAIARATVAEIEEYNILNCAMLAMKRAVEQLGEIPGICLIDGNKIPDMDIKAEAVVKGDGKSQSVAAASILAKVARDRYMLEMSEKYPDYKFEKHKGYGTKLHYQMLDEHGECEIHRHSFLRKYYERKENGSQHR